jgi:hypothetical protein
MLRHACGYDLANDGHDTRAIQAYWASQYSEHDARPPWRRSGLRSFFKIDGRRRGKQPVISRLTYLSLSSFAERLLPGGATPRAPIIDGHSVAYEMKLSTTNSPSAKTYFAPAVFCRAAGAFYCCLFTTWPTP